MRTARLKVLVLLVVLDALAGSVGELATLHYALTHDELPIVAGVIRALSGPFEALGIDALIAAALVFVLVSALKFLSAFWLWNVRVDGAVLQTILLGVSVIFWYGFALPHGPLLGIPQIVLIVLLWKDLK